MQVAFRKHDPSLFGRLICIWTRSPYSHCEIILGRTMISAVEGEGVRLMTVLDPLPTNKWAVINVPTNVSDEGAVYSWVMGELGCKYDWLGIVFTQIFHFGRQHKDRWFCSEFCTAALQQAGIVTNVKPYHQNPGSLYRLLKGLGYAEIR